MQIDNVCPVCNEEVKSICHALVQCKTARACWQVFNPNIGTEGSWDFPVWLEQTLASQLITNKARVLILCWPIWRSEMILFETRKDGQTLKLLQKRGSIFHSGHWPSVEFLGHLFNLR